MDSKNEQQIILEQYKIYSEAKDKFIDRQFSNNKFYLVLNIVILLTTYVLSGLFPQKEILIIIMSFIGISLTLMWWMNIDSYQLLIKIKYSKVLEYLETKLPEQPYYKEFQDYKAIKQQKNLIVFGDFQKILALVISSVYFIAGVYEIVNVLKNLFLYS